MEQLGQTTAQSRDWKQDLWIPRPRVMLYHIVSKASSIAKLYKWPLIHYIFLFYCFQFLSLSLHKKYICLHNNSIVVSISVLISLSQIAHICYLILMMISILQCQVNYFKDYHLSPSILRVMKSVTINNLFYLVLPSFCSAVILHKYSLSFSPSGVEKLQFK